jgi:hypothetical protein
MSELDMLQEQVRRQSAEIEHYRNAFNDEAKICADREQEIERLKEIIMSCKKGFHLVGSAVSAHPTSRAVEQKLLDASNIYFKPARNWIYEQEKDNERFKTQSFMDTPTNGSQ